MRCPVCVDENLVISSREGIEIDHCPQCRGVWLDRGELDKIIERAAPSVVGAAPASQVPPPGAPVGAGYRQPHPDDRYRDDRYRDDRYRDDRSYKKRKKRSFLEEIFDFD